ncbi:MAG TPA: adenylyl-sulfate kinase [Streptosporangiaceae bacterium]|nr:adenylyl-sulfate kinase [Streptosporangiaceae bacterium]
MPGDYGDGPAWTPGEAELGHLELLLSGGLAPLRGFLGSYDTESVLAGRRLADGTPWPVPITLAVSAEVADELAARPDDGRRLVLHDPEGTPLALLEVTEIWPYGDETRVAGPVTALRPPAHGTFRALRRPPAEVRAARSGDGLMIAVAVRGPLHRRETGQLRQIADKLGATVLVLPLLTGEHQDGLVRALLAVRKEMPGEALVVPVPLDEHPDAERDLLLRAHVAAAYGATHLFVPAPHPGAAGEQTAEQLAERLADEAPLELVVPEPWAYDESVEVWRPTARIEPDHIRAETLQLDAMLDRGDPIPEWYTFPAVARELRAARPPRVERGLTVFFTGLSGSGKSTIARGLADALIERGGRTVTLLDGDVVRRLLSAGLTFSKTDRDLNIRRIGYVAAEVTRHGGLAICAPIAPYAATRREVRTMVSTVGDFVLVYVATPLAECERRDRKGLYAKARAGLIPEFTGVSDPYEPPDDADLVLDTSGMEPADAVAAVLDLLIEGGWVAAD